MSQFIVRVVLHEAVYPKDYSKLHEVLEERGYSRTMKAGNGVEYHLPPATYHVFHDGATTNTICTEVKAMANSTDYKNSIFVAETKSITFNNLDPVKV